MSSSRSVLLCSFSRKVEAGQRLLDDRLLVVVQGVCECPLPICVARDRSLAIADVVQGAERVAVVRIVRLNQD